VGDGAAAGRYTTSVAIKPERGEVFEILVSLEVLPFRLVQGIPWGFYMYHQHWLGIDQPEYRERILRRFKEMQQFGVSGGTISINTVATPGVSADGTVDFSMYDLAVDLYQEAGFREPPTIAMEGLMRAIADAKGKADEMRFGEIRDRFFEYTDGWEPGVKPEEVPEDVHELACRVVRRIHDHSLEKQWGPFYFYAADEPSSVLPNVPGITPNVPNMWKAMFMYGIADEAAPKMKTAGTVYKLEDWKTHLDGLLDLDIVHFKLFCCFDAATNRRWREFAARKHAKLYGIDFMGAFDDFWQGRWMTLIGEKGRLDGIRNWIQWFGEEPESDFEMHPYKFLSRKWKGGPYVLHLKDGRVVRSMVWLGIREGIDDSRYLRTVRTLIDKANQSNDPEQRKAAEQAARKVDEIMGRVPWVDMCRSDESTWTNIKADSIRHELADVARRLHYLLQESND
jgi:hypothetical protein